MRYSKLVLQLHRVFQVGSQPSELSLPGRHRIRFVALDHVTHSKRNAVQVVLDAKQLQRIFTISIDKIALYLPQGAICRRIYHE